MKDFLGQEIKVGDWIAYPRGKSSMLWMQLGCVVSVDEERKKICVSSYRRNWRGNFEQSEKNSTIERVERVVIVSTERALGCV